MNQTSLPEMHQIIASALDENTDQAVLKVQHAI